MSKQYFNVKWRTTINQLMDALQVEMDPAHENQVRQNMKYARSDQEWFQYYGKLYLFYVDAYKALEACYDQLLHPQKRKLMKKMLQNVMLRQIQIKQNSIFYSIGPNVIRSDFVNFHEVMFDEKRILQSTEVQLPRFFVDDNNRKKAYRTQMLNKFLEEFHDNTMPEEEVLIDGKNLEALKQDQLFEFAFRTIQKIERGRQGINRVLLAKQIKKNDERKMEKHRKLQDGQEVHESTEREEAITIIQKYYRGYKGREIVWAWRQEESLFLGFQLEKPLQQTDAYLTYEGNREQMKIKQKERLQEYKEALLEAKDNLQNNWGEDMQTNMLNDRRRWYMGEVYKTEGKLVPPKANQYYKKDVVRPPLTEEEQEMMDILDKEKKAAKKNKGKKKKKKQVEDEDIRVEQGPPENVVKLQDMIEKHNKDWRNDQLNFNQKHEDNLLKGEIAKDVEKQIRSVVDDMIDMELCNLRIALKAKKFKYPKKKKSKKKKAAPKPKDSDDEEDILEEGEIQFKFRSTPKKKKKKFPGDKGTNKKDPRDMLAELIESGIVKKLQPARINELLGDPNPMRQKQEMLQEQCADPSIFDLRQLLVQFVGMPLGSTYIKDNIKETNYVLFYGPHGSGKTHAVRALQTECDALVIDLSPSNIENKYIDKPDYMLSLCFKVAACFQPSIIYIDEVERIFKGKKKKKKGQVPPSTGGMNWVKMRKFLLKYGKYFSEKQKENVTIIGCTYAPWSANKKQLKSFFKRKIYFPCPNYATRLLIFKKYFEDRRIELHPNFPINSLAHATEGFTAGNIKEALNKVMTSRRLLLSDKIPYRISEFVDPLSIQQSTFLQQYLEFRKFHDEMSGNKARVDKLKKPDDDDKKGKKKPAKKK